MLPLGPEPVTPARSTPSSRANLRTDGEAWALRAEPSPAPSALPLPLAGEGWGEGVDAGSLPLPLAGEGWGEGAAAGSLPLPLAGEGWGEGAAASSVRMTLPSLTLSPTFTCTALTTPAAGDGTSI